MKISFRGKDIQINKKDVEEMFDLVVGIIDSDGCAWIMSRPFKGETCKEYMESIQGKGYGYPCSRCAAEELFYRLTKNGS